MALILAVPAVVAEEDANPKKAAPAAKQKREPRAQFGIAPKWEDDWRPLPRNLVDDVKTVFGKQNFLYNFIVLGGAGALSAISVDQWDHRAARDFRHHDRLGKGADIGDVIGHPATHFGVTALLYLYGRNANDPAAVEASKRLAEALIINDLIVLTIKLSTGRNRPNGDHFSFPSGHVASMFAMAAALDGVYGPAVSLPLYLTGCFVGLARMDQGKHYISDLIFGAALGYVIGRAVTKSHERKILGFDIEPWIDERANATGLMLQKHF